MTEESVNRTAASGTAEEIEPLTAADSDVRAAQSFHPQPSAGGLKVMGPMISCLPPMSVTVAAGHLQQYPCFVQPTPSTAQIAGVRSA